MNLLVSVIVPIYNVEKYLKECLDSLVNQTYSNVEIILINDGSRDNSAQIAKYYVDKFENFVLYEQENKGLSAARNLGIEHSKGEYICFLDSDDYLVNDAIARLVQLAQNKNLDLIKFSAFSFYDEDRTLFREEFYQYQGQYDVCCGKEFLEKEIKQGDIYNVSCALMLIKRKCISDNGLRFVEGIIHEDIIFNWELITLCKRIYVFNEPLYCRRYRQGSITRTIDWKKKIEAMVCSMHEAELFLSKHDTIKEEDNRWYLSFLSLKVLQHWVDMSPKDRKDFEIRKLVDETRKYIRRHRFFERKGLVVFMVSPYLYLAIHKVVSKLK